MGVIELAVNILRMVRLIKVHIRDMVFIYNRLVGCNFQGI